MPNDIERILMLLDGLYSKEEALQWLDSPQKLLGGDTPRARIEQGDFETVKLIVEELKLGVYI